jgi:Pla-1/cef family extracellular lipase
MTPLFRISLISASVLLAACGDESGSTLNTDPAVESALNSDTVVNFVLQGDNQSVPVPTYTLVNQQDGTLQVPTGDDDALTNPAAAMNTSDGWSTTMPIVIDFKGDGFADGIVPTGVYLVELTDSMTGSPTPKAVLTQNVDFVVQALGNTLYVQPLSPLNPVSEYIVAVTSEVEDIDGDSVGTSGSYSVLKDKTRILTSAPLDSLQQLTHGVEALFAATGVDSDSIIYSTWFSTHSSGETLFATKVATGLGLTAVDGLNSVWKQSANPNDVDLLAGYVMSFDSTQSYTDALNDSTNFNDYISNDPAFKANLIANFGALPVNVTSGTVSLPHYLEKGLEWSSAPFESAMPSLALLTAALNDPEQQQTVIEQLIANGIDVSKFTADLSTEEAQQAAFLEALNLIGVDLTKADGSPLDEERLITRYAPVPKIKSLEDVEFLLFAPQTLSANTPVVIYQHGITSAKENAFAFAAGLAAQNIAVLAIDLPLHGSRSLDAERSANANLTAYLNLANLAVARDNLRQSVLDTIALRTALSYSALAYAPLGLDSPLAMYDVSSPRMVGHSLGGIVGTSAVSAANRPTGNAQLDAMTQFSSLTVANSGGQITPLLFGSQAFGNVVKHNIALGSSSDYQQFTSAFCVPSFATSESFENDCFTAFVTQYAEAIPALESAFAQFSLAAQTVLDGIDPLTNAGYIDSELPVLFIQADGDNTVPNNVAGQVLAGSEPLAAALGFTLESMQANVGDLSGTRGYFGVENSNQGHSTFVSPNSTLTDAIAHLEMQTLLSDFLGDNTINGTVN